MTAFSFKSYATREKVQGERTKLVTIQHGHPLNNDHRAPFASGETAARALLVHAQRELSDPVKGPEYFNRLKQEHDKATITGQRVAERLRQRQSRAAVALSNSDVDLTAEQLQLVADIAMVQAEIAERLLPAVTADGRSADTVIDQIDAITRKALRSATHLRTEQQVGAEVDPNAWSRELADTLANVPGVDPNNEADSMARTDLVVRFSALVYKLEESLPLAVERDEPLWEIDDAIDPHTVAATVDKLGGARGSDFDPEDLEANEELAEQARMAIWQSMSADEREFAATKIALTPAQRIEVGMSLVNSTPPLIRLPEAELGQGRFDVRMATVEEAQVMDSLIRWAGQERAYPGPEVSADRIEAMKEVAMPAGDQGRYTIGFAVANNPASISHAAALIERAAENENVRILIHTDIPAVAEELMRVRIESVRAAGRETSFKDASDATRDFGGWTLPDGNGEDRILGADPRDAAIFVANSDKVWAYPNTIDLEITSQREMFDQLHRANNAVRATEADVKRAREAFEASRDQKLVAKAKALADDGKDNKAALAAADKSGDKKLLAEIEKRETAHKAAMTAQNRADRLNQKIIREAAQDGIRVSAPGDIARATIVDLSQQQGKLAKVYVPGRVEQGAAIETNAGVLTDQRLYVAQLKAQRLRNGDAQERQNLRKIFHSSRGVNAILIDGSNFFREDKGAKAGMAALRERLTDLSPTATLLTSNNDKNPISSEVVTKLGRRAIHATAWRVSDHSNPIDSDGRRVTLSERKTELDLGLVGFKKDVRNPETGEMEPQEAARTREWAYKDLKGAVVVVEGGGSMTRDTYDAIQALAVERGLTGHSLTQKEVMDAYNHLAANGRAHLEAPKLASPALARAIMQEALVDYANQAVLGSDMGKDYHSANLIRQAADADKLATVIGKDGKSVPLAAAYEHSLQYAPSIADNTRKDLGQNLTASVESEYGQLVLNSMNGISPDRARMLGETYATLGDIMQAAEAGEASAALPKSLHHDMSRPNTWAAAFDRASEIENQVGRTAMEPIAVTNPLYPTTVKESGRAEMLYAMGDVDLNVPTLAVVVGGKAKTTEADLEAVRAVAIEAKQKNWAVSIHLSGDAAADMAKTMAQLPENERPRILLVGDGHPMASGDAKVRDAMIAVGEAGGGYVTPVAPVTKVTEGENETYVANRRSALDFQGRQASGLVVAKSSGNDIELLALKSAMAAGRPVGAIGPSDAANPTVDDLRFRSSGYSANMRLLTGGNRISVMLDTRHVAFQPNFIPDLTAQTEQRYVLFEGSTAGMMNAPDSNRRDQQEIDRSAIESGTAMHTQIAWSDRAEYLANGRGTGDFISKIEAGEARQIEAKEADIARMARENDARFLDISHRLHGRNDRIDVREHMAEIAEQSSAAIEAEAQAHFLAQRGGMGR